MIECPFCGFKGNIITFKQLRKPWKFRIYIVRRLECPSCKGIFNYYEGKSDGSKQSSFTIPKKKDEQLTFVFLPLNFLNLYRKKKDEQLIECPFCGFESDINTFKQLREPWKFNIYTVTRLECPSCKGIFNYYEGISSSNKRTSFTIPKKKGK